MARSLVLSKSEGARGCNEVVIGKFVFGKCSSRVDENIRLSRCTYTYGWLHFCVPARGFSQVVWHFPSRLADGRNDWMDRFKGWQPLIATTAIRVQFKLGDALGKSTLTTVSHRQKV